MFYAYEKIYELKKQLIYMLYMLQCRVILSVSHILSTHLIVSLVDYNNYNFTSFIKWNY